MLLCSKHSFEVCGAHEEVDEKPHVFGQLVPNALRASLFNVFPSLGERATGLPAWYLLAVKGTCLLPSKRRPAATGHRQQPIFAIAPSSALQITSRDSPSLLEAKECCELLLYFRCQAKVWDVLCDYWQLSIFRILHCLFQRWMRYTCEVPGQVEPCSPTRGTPLARLT